MTAPPFPCQPALASHGGRAHVVGMAAKDKDEERQERLAAALRENLRRRKAQSREASAPAEPPRSGSS